jgi:uncharacterized membrane protein
MKLKSNKYLLLSLVFFGLIYALISIINHYNFRTYALDLGLYTNALYKYAHFGLADSLMVRNSHEYLLGSHFDLYLVLFSPLVYIFRTYTLLIVQIASVLAGGIGVYKYFELIKPKYRHTPLFASVYFFLFYGIYSALSYDYHSNVVAAMIIPWFFYFFKKKNYLVSAILVLFIVISQENIALWLTFICLGLAFECRKDKVALSYLSVFMIFSLIYFLIVIYVIIPGFSNSNEYTGFSYSILGGTPFEALKNLILHPVDNFKVLFINHNQSIAGDYVKLEMHLMVLISGMFLLFLKPHYLFMLIPVYFQKLFHDNYVVWGIDCQYSIEFAPILTIGIFSAINEFKNEKAVKILTAMVIFGVLFSTVKVMDKTVLYTNKSRIRFYSADHYKRKYDVNQVHKQLDQIPGDAIICAQSPFVPHFTLRDKIYRFPMIKDANYIVVSEKEDIYPFDNETFQQKINQLKLSGEWETLNESEGLVVLKRKR